MENNNQIAKKSDNEKAKDVPVAANILPSSITPAGVVTLGGKKRVIRKVAVLDPSKITKLGFDKIFIQAVNKLQGPGNLNTVQKQSFNIQTRRSSKLLDTSQNKQPAESDSKKTIDNNSVFPNRTQSAEFHKKAIENECSTKSIDSIGQNPESIRPRGAKPTLNATIRELVARRKRLRNATRVLSFSECGETSKGEEGAANNESKNTLSTPKRRRQSAKITLSEIELKKVDQAVQKSVEVDFEGFSSNEISLGDDALKRLGEAIEKCLLLEPSEKIPSFNNLKDYLNNKKRALGRNKSKPVLLRRNRSLSKQASPTVKKTQTDSVDLKLRDAPESQPKGSNECQTQDVLAHGIESPSSIQKLHNLEHSVTPREDLQVKSSSSPVNEVLSENSRVVTEETTVNKDSIRFDSAVQVCREEILDDKQQETIPNKSLLNDGILADANGIKDDTLRLDLNELSGIFPVPKDENLQLDCPDALLIGAPVNQPESHTPQTELIVNDEKSKTLTKDCDPEILPSIVPLDECIIQPSLVIPFKCEDDKNTQDLWSSGELVNGHREHNYASKSASSSAEKVSGKGIVILDQQIFKSGTPFPPSVLYSNLIGNLSNNFNLFLNHSDVVPGYSADNSFASDIVSQEPEIHPKPVNSLNCPITLNQPNAPPPSAPPPSAPTERTILVKVLNQDPQSNDIQIEIVDPILKPPKKAEDPIKTICKSYVRKMMKSSGIKKIKINSSKSEVRSPLKSEHERAGDSSMNEAKDCDSLSISADESPMKQMISPKKEYPPVVSQLGSVDSQLIDNSNSFTQANKQHISNISMACQENELSWQKCSSSVHDFGNNVGDKVSDDNPMDAVEYILNCTQNTMNQTTQFEDEEWAMNDWDDENVDEEESEESTIPNRIENNAYDERIVNGATSDIACMIEKAELTFEADIKPSSQLLEAISMNRVKVENMASNLENPRQMLAIPSVLIKSENTYEPAGINVPVTTQYAQVKTEPFYSEPHSNEAVADDSNSANIPPKKRKRIILNYANTLVGTPVDKITERIRQRMIDKVKLENVSPPAVDNIDPQFPTDYRDKTHRDSSRERESEKETTFEESESLRRNHESKPMTNCIDETSQYLERNVTTKGEETSSRNEENITEAIRDHLKISFQNVETKAIEKPEEKTVPGQNAIPDVANNPDGKKETKEVRHFPGRRPKVIPVMRGRSRANAKSNNSTGNKQMTLVKESGDEAHTASSHSSPHPIISEDHKSTLNRTATQIQSRSDGTESMHPEIDLRKASLSNTQHLPVERRRSESFGTQSQEQDIHSCPTESELVSKPVETSMGHLENATTTADKTPADEESANIPHNDQNNKTNQLPLPRTEKVREYSVDVKPGSAHINQDSGNIGVDKCDELTSVDRKSHRVRKPVNNPGFIMDPKNTTRKENKPKTCTDEQQIETNTIDDTPFTETKQRLSKRKNTLPEIQKLGLNKRSLKRHSEQENSTDDPEKGRKNQCTGYEYDRPRWPETMKTYAHGKYSQPVLENFFSASSTPKPCTNERPAHATPSFVESSPILLEIPQKRRRGRPPKKNIIPGTATNLSSFVEATSLTTTESCTSHQDATASFSAPMCERKKKPASTKSVVDPMRPEDVENESLGGVMDTQNSNDEANDSGADSFAVEETQLIATSVISNKISKRRNRGGRPKKDINPQSSTLISSFVTTPDNSTNKKRKTSTDCYFHPMLLMATSHDEMQASLSGRETQTTVNVSPENDVIDKPIPSGSARCGVCKQDVVLKTFKDHLKLHYGVGWRMQLDRPINLTSYREVLNQMIYFTKQYKQSTLTCKSCNESKKSAAGMMTHLQSCLLTTDQLDKLMEPCEFCERKMMPVAQWTHVKVCKRNPANGKLDDETMVESWEKGAPLESKRKSAIKASSSFKDIVNSCQKFNPDDFVKLYQCAPLGGILLRWRSQIKKRGVAKCFEKDCNFQSSDVDQLKQHLKACQHLRRGGFKCVRCNFYSIKETEVRDHVISEHDNIINGETPKEIKQKPQKDDAEYCGSGSETESESEHTSMHSEKEMSHSFSRFSSSKHPNFFTITKQFFSKIHTDDALFPSLGPPHITLSSKSFQCFKPALERSLKFGYCGKHKFVNNSVGVSKPSGEWMQLKPFEAISNEGEGCIFLGGPIVHSAWAPKCLNVEDSNFEYLAVLCRREMKSGTKVLNPQAEDELIFVYRVSLCNGIKTELLYGLECNGPINHFVFLPSGGYAPEINRLGLLAIGLPTSNINIYALPLKAIDDNCDNIIYEESNFKILDLKPSLILCVDLNGKAEKNENYKSPCSKLVWSEVKPHNIIAAGYSNGFVGLWDVREGENLTRIDVDGGCPYYVPLSYFSASRQSVTALAMHYTVDEPRWLMVTSRIREFQCFDMEDMTNPAPIIKEGFQKSGIGAAVWSIYAESPLMGLDGDYVEFTSGVFTGSLYNVTFKVKHYMHSATGYTCLDFTPWHNAFIGGCENGDIIIQRFQNTSMESLCINIFPGRNLFFTDIVRLDGDAIPNVASDSLKQIVTSETLPYLDSFNKKHNETFGLVFGGPVKCSRPQNKVVTSIDRVTPFALTRLTRVNCIATCPNMFNTQLVSVGHNNGFLRIKILKYNDYR